LAIWLLLFVRITVPSGVFLVLADSSGSTVNLNGRQCSLLGQSARQDRDILADKPIKNAIVDLSHLGSEFIDTISQQVGPRTP
jgi:hypothetical protein